MNCVKKQKASTLVITNTAMTIAGEISSGDVALANESVLVFASVNGDASVPTLLGKIPKAGLVQLLVATATSPSSINADSVKPSDFAGAFAELPKTWSPRMTHGSTRMDIQELILGIAMRTDEDGNLVAPGKYLAALEKNPETAKILAWWLWPNAAEITGFVRTGKWGNPVLDGGLAEDEEDVDSADELAIAQFEANADEADDLAEPDAEAKVKAMFDTGRRGIRISSTTEGDWQHFIEVLKKKAPVHLSRILECWMSWKKHRYDWAILKTILPSGTAVPAPSKAKAATTGKSAL
jgi:hypothetical protein